MASTPSTGTGTGTGHTSTSTASAQSSMTHARTALMAALFLVCAATATTGVSAFVAPTSRVGVGVVLSTDTRLQLSTFGGGNRNNDGEGYSTSNVNDASVRSTQSSTYRPLFDGGTNSVELPMSGIGIGNGWTRGNGRGLGRNGNRGNSFNNNNFANTYNGRSQQRRRNSSSNTRGGGGGGGLANLFNFGNQSNKNNYYARQNQQQQRYTQPAGTYRNANGFGGTGNRRTSNFSNRISDGGRGYTGGGPSLSVGRLFRQQQKQQRQQQLQTMGSGRYTYNNANSNRQFQSLTNNRRGGTSTGRLSDIGKAQANRQLTSRNRAAEQAAQRRLRQAQSGTFNNGFNNRYRSNALGSTFQGVGLGGSSTRRAGLFGGRNSIGSGVLNNSYKAKLNARTGYRDGNRNYYKYSTATSPSLANAPNSNTAAALVNSAAFSARRNSGGFNAQGSRFRNNSRVRLSDIGKYDNSNRRGIGRSIRLSDVGKAPSFNAFDRFSNDNRALSWQDRMDRTFYRGDGASRRSASGYYDSYDYENEYGFRNKNVWGGRWRGPRRDIDRRGGVIDVDFTTNEGRSAYGRQSRGPNVLRKLSKTIVDSGAKIRITNEIKKLERQIKNRKSRFNAEVYDIMAEIDNEYGRYGRGSLDDREMEMMDREKDSRTRRAYDKARRDVDFIQDKIDRLREELFDLEDAMSETWDNDSFRRSLPPARRDDYYDRQARRSSDRFSLPPSGGSRSRLSDIEREERRMPVGRSRYDDYERRGPGENRMRREEEEERQRRLQDEMLRRQDEMQMMEDEQRRRQQEEEENIRFQQQRQQEEEEMYRMQQARQEQEEREMRMYNSGDGYRREEYDRMAGWQQQQRQQPPRPQDEATWTRDDELRAVNDPYRRVDPSGRPSESGRGGMQGQTSTTRRVDDRYGNSVGQW